MSPKHQSRADHDMTRDIWTLGHSNLSIEAFLRLLEAPSIEQIVDVRRFPGSRLWPQYQGEALARRLSEAGIGYRHLVGLGGRRSARLPGSPNTAWRVESFNAYADHMASSEFQTALEELERLASERRTAIMCAEAVPWRCHRRVLADALIVRDWNVWDVLSARKVEPHRLTDFARVVDGRPTYPDMPLFASDSAL